MIRINRLIALLLVGVLAVGPVFAQAPAPQPTAQPPVAPPAAVALPKPQTLAELQTRIAALLEQPKFAAARLGALIKSANSQVLFERDADKAFMPASNMKLYTSAAALDAFGPDFRIKTSVYATKPVGKNGTLRGDVIFYGRGDPALSPRFDAGNDPFGDFTAADTITAVEQLADQIKARGVRRIVGNLIGDESYFAGDPLGPGWEWDDAQFYYGAEMSALTVNDNVVTFTVLPARRVGEAPTISVQPRTDYAVIVNHATTSANGATRIGVHRPLNANVVEFFGTIPRDTREFKVDIAVHDPAQFAAVLLKEALARRGIAQQGRVLRMDATARLTQPFDETKWTELAAVTSPPLAVLLKVVNKPSQNLHTELLLRQLGARLPWLEGEKLRDEYGRPKPAAGRGNEARQQFLLKAGADIQPLSLRDGSGLSRQGLVTPRASVRLLEFMAAHPHAAVFRDSLPVGGVDGTLERRLRDTAAAGNVRAKTGTLTHVNALSGYVTTRRGQPLIFSLMGNNYVGAGRDVTGVFDQICALLAEFENEL